MGRIGAFEVGEFGFELVDARVELGDGDIFLAVAALELFNFELQRGVFVLFAVQFGFQFGDAFTPMLEVKVGALEDGADDINVVGALFEPVTEKVAEEGAEDCGDERNEDGFGHAFRR